MMNQGARNKLRNMGGIMASSPKLMQAAFQDGGPVMPVPPLAPRTSGVTRPGTGAPLVGLGRVPPMMPGKSVPDRAPIGLASDSAVSRAALGGRGITMQDWQSMSRQEREALGFPVSPIGGSLFFDRFGVGLGLVEPDARYTSEGPVQTEAERLMAQSVLSRQGILPLPGEGPLGDVIKKQQEVAVADEVARGERVQRRQESRVKELRDRLAEANTPEEKAAISNQINELDAARQEGVTRGQPLTMDEATLPSTETADSRQEYFEQGGPRGLEALATPIQTSVQDPEKAEKMQQALKKALEEQDTSTGDGDDDGGGDGGPPPAPSKKDLRSRYKEKLELFKEIYGEDDEERARDKAMSLAMLGLAIASGQSPDFLTNVTQGTMAGLQGMSEQEQARRERERGLQTLALETAIGEQSAATEAQRQAVEGELEFKRNLALERVKQGTGGAGGLELEPVKAVAEHEAEQVSKLRTGIRDGSETVPEQYRENPEAWVDLQRRKSGRNYAFGLMQQAGPDEMPGLMRSGQLYLYRNENNLPIVTSPTDLAFILPGQDYVEYDRTTNTSTVTTKPMPE